MSLQIKTNNSESRGQEEATIQDHQVSCLHARHTALKFTNANVKMYFVIEKMINIDFDVSCKEMILLLHFTHSGNSY